MNRKTGLRITMFLLGLSAITFGIFRGEAMEILGKATMVCFSCIGLG